MTQNIIITGNRHSQKHINIMEMDPYNSKTANLLHEFDPLGTCCFSHNTLVF